MGACKENNQKYSEMSKVYLKVEMRVIVDTDLESVDDIVENLDFDITPNSENVEVYDTEIQNFHVEDSK